MKSKTLTTERMSELILLVARGGRWTEGCRLVRECQSHCLFRISPCNKVSENWSKTSCSLAVANRTTSQEPMRWNSLRGFWFRPPDHVGTSILSSTEVRGSRRAASIVSKRNTHSSPGDNREVIVCGSEDETERAAKASLCLQRLLGFDNEKADNSVKDHQSFAVINPADIPRNYEALRDAGFSSMAIKQNPWILSYPRQILKAKIEAIVDMNIPVIDDAIPFLKLGVGTLYTFSIQLQNETTENRGANRITYLTEQLQRPMLEVCQVLAKHYFMRTVLFSKISQVLKLMLEFHISKDDILKDVWAFRYNVNMIVERLKRVTDAGVHPVKPWMIRCPEVSLSRRIKRELGRRSLLGNEGTIVEYLSRRFECDKKTITTIIGKNPKVAQVNEQKMKRVVDFLLENGYKVEHVIRVPGVFFHRLETMQERLTELQKYKHKPNSLIVFCKSKQQYKTYLNTVKLKLQMTDGR